MDEEKIGKGFMNTKFKSPLQMFKAGVEFAEKEGVKLFSYRHFESKHRLPSLLCPICNCEPIKKEVVEK